MNIAKKYNWLHGLALVFVALLGKEIIYKTDLTFMGAALASISSGIFVGLFGIIGWQLSKHCVGKIQRGRFTEQNKIYFLRTLPILYVLAYFALYLILAATNIINTPLENNDRRMDAAVRATINAVPARPTMQMPMATAVGTNPGMQAEARRVAARTGVPVQTVFAQPEAMKSKAALADDEYQKLYPASALALTNEELATIAQNDNANNSEYIKNLVGIITLVIGMSVLIIKYKLWICLNKLTARQRTVTIALVSWFAYVLIRSAGRFELLGFNFHTWDESALLTNLLLPPLLIALAYFAFRWARSGKESS